MRAAAVFAASLAVVALLGAPRLALAQEAQQEAYASATSADEPASPDLRGAVSDESDIPGDALTLDPATLNGSTRAKSLRLPGLSSRPGLDVSRTDRPDGSGTVVLKQPLPIDWDAKVGADLGLAASPSDIYQPGRRLPGSRDGSGSGAAWASVGVVPNLATVDARVDPGNDQGKFGTTFKHSVPLGEKFAVTVRNSYSMTQTYSAAAPGPADVPLMTLPAATSPVTPQIWGSEKAAKFDILPTGTSFGASFASSSTDPVTHNKLSAEQKLYGPLQVTTAVTDVGQTYANKSISARFKLNW